MNQQRLFNYDSGLLVGIPGDTNNYLYRKENLLNLLF